MKIKEKLGIFAKKHQKMLILLLLFVFSMTIFMLFNEQKYKYYNNYSYLADAILDGHIDVPKMPDYLESIEFQGYKYMHFAPGCAWLSIPFVLFWGIEGFNPTYLVIVLGALNSVLAYLILEERELGRSSKGRALMALMLTIGTVHCFCASNGSSWFFRTRSNTIFLTLFLHFLISLLDMMCYIITM